MLVSGWTINGTFGSSYVNTMGFGASARGIMETTLSGLSSLRVSNKFSPSARRALGLYGLFQRFTTFHKANKPTRYRQKLTGATVDFSLTPPHYFSVKSISYTIFFLILCHSLTCAVRQVIKESHLCEALCLIGRCLILLLPVAQGMTVSGKEVCYG